MHSSWLLPIKFVFQLQYMPPNAPIALPYLLAGHHRQHTTTVLEQHSRVPKSFLFGFVVECSYPCRHSTFGTFKL